MESSKYAIISTGGKQYQVAPGQRLFVERLTGEAGSGVSFDQVLLVNQGEGNAAADRAVIVGTPTVAGASVTAKIVKHDRGPKAVTYKKKIKQGFTKKQGHRQERTQVLIESINI